MSRRAWLLGVLLVLSLGSSVVAQSPSPEATPLYAPEDLILVLPGKVGSLELGIEEGDIEKALADPETGEVFPDLLWSLGKELTDVTLAIGVSVAQPTDTSLLMVALRVDGVPAAIALQPFLAAATQIDLSNPPPGFSTAWQDIGGRSVLVISEDGPEDWLFSYAKGEVIFMVVGLGDIIVEDVLAELP